MGHPNDLPHVTALLGKFNYEYGAGPLHLLFALLSFAAAGYAVSMFFERPEAWNIVVWFVGAIVVHDLVAYPVYTVIDRTVFQRLARVPPGTPGRLSALNYVRVPVILSAFGFVVWFPLVLRLATRYEGASGFTPDIYLWRWLAITGAAFFVSGLAYAFTALRLQRQQRRASD
jgi:hypothetical protein